MTVSSPLALHVAPHPLLELAAFLTTFPAPIGTLPAAAFASWLSLDAAAPLRTDDDVRAAVRDLLRHGGYKPTGRGKPASEYLLRAAQEGRLGPINPAVDAANAVSLHSGLPVSVVDVDLLVSPARVEVAAPGASYVFNAAGQEIDVGGLLCLADAEGPCANAVKDAQRTKTSPATTRTLSLVWGTRALSGRAAQAAEWYRRLLETVGGTTTPVT